MTLLAIALTGLSLTACNGEDDLDTNQYSGGVSLGVYGPQPVMRGGTLRFLGSNLDQIAQVKIPGVDPITNIDVKQSGVPSEIWVTVPKEGPEEGYVTLVTKTDQEITTVTKLTYEEPIVITTVTASAMPGETITIEGDYLNLIQMVQFANEDENVYVGQGDFTEHTRYVIKLVVPETARTGKLSLYTLDLTDEANDPNSMTYNIVQTDDAITIGTPTVSKFATPRGEASANGNATAKLGETITVTGLYFNLVDAVAIGDADSDAGVVTVEDITVSSDGKTISFVLPAEAPDGDINLVTRSGLQVPVGVLTTVAPSECVASPSPVKAGAALTITGKDLDVVSSVEMTNVSDAIEFTVNEGGTQLVITAVPEAAQEGNLVLRMANTKGVDVTFTLVKPEVTGYDNSTVSAGSALTLKGTNLDLVQSVTFGEATATEVNASADGTTLALTVPMAATTGKPVLNLKNGTTVEAPELTVNEAVFCYVVAFPDEENTPEAGSTMTVDVMNGDKLTNAYVNGTEVKFVYDSKNSKLTVGIPQSAKASSTLKLVSSNGEIEYSFSVIPAGSVTTVIWTGPVDLNSWGNTIELPANSFTDVDPSATVTLRIDYTPTADSDVKIKWYGGHWNNIAMPGSEGDENIVTLDPTATSVDMELTAEQLANLQEYNDWGYCGLFHGQGAIINKVSMIVKTPLETTIWSGSVDLGSWSINYEINDGNGNANLFNGACKAGTILRVYVDAYSDWSQIQLFDGHWGGLNFVNNGNSNNFNSDMAQWAEHPTYYEVTLTADEADKLNSYYDWGYCLIIQGEGCYLKKVTIE